MGPLYIVKQSIFALNPKVGKVGANGKPVPEKLWDVAIENPKAADNSTPSPDGRFLYALTRLADKYSGFIAINAQTGKDIQLLAGKVDTSGTIVTWVSGLTFDKAAVIEGQRIPIGRGEKTKFCTVQAKSPRSLTCKEDIGKQSEVPWADFPEYLTGFRYPVVARGLHDVDYIYIAGNLEKNNTVGGEKQTRAGAPTGTTWRDSRQSGNTTREKIALLASRSLMQHQCRRTLVCPRRDSTSFRRAGAENRSWWH